MVVFEKNSVDEFIHDELAGAVGVVPGKVDARVQVAFPVFGDVILAFKYVS